jgi:hypothetical protein
MKPKPALKADGLALELTSYTVNQTAKALQLHPESVRDFGGKTGFAVFGWTVAGG